MDHGNAVLITIVGHRDNVQFQTSVVGSHVMNLVAVDDRLIGVDHGRENVCVPDLVFSR